MPAICAPPISSTWINGPQHGLSRNCSPCSSFIAAVGYCSLNNRRLLYHLLRLSNIYCTVITPFFSPRLGFSDISINGSGTGCLLGWFFTISLFLTLAPRDSITYCQARGLSGHTSPHGECACFILDDSAPLEAEDYLPFS